MQTKQNMKHQRKPLSDSEGYSMIERFYKSGMSSKSYYTTHNYSEWQFYKWKRLYLLAHPELSNPSNPGEIPCFHTVHLQEEKPSSTVSANTGEVSLSYPNGITLRFPRQLYTLEEINTLIQCFV